MGSGQAGAEVITDGGAPTLTCLHEAPIVAMPTADVVGCINSAGGNAVPGNSVQDAMAHQLVPVVAHSLRGEGFDASEDGTGRGTPLVPMAFQPGNLTRGAGAEPSVTTFPTLRTSKGSGRSDQDPHVAYAIQAGATRTNPASGPDGVGVQADHAYTLEARAEVQAVAVAFHENQRAEITTSDTAGSLKLGGGKPGQGYPAVQHGMAVRRLTPRECERLQGFPDDYTLIPWRGKPASECPDGPRYKALGNSWAVPCARWIGVRIAGALA